MTNPNKSNEQAKCAHWYIRLVNLTTLCDFYQCKFCGKKLEAL